MARSPASLICSRWLAGACSEAEKQALFYDTAKRVYRLDVP